MFHDDTQTEIVEFSNEYFVFYTNGDFNLGPASLQAMERGSSASAPEIVGFGNDPVSVTIGNADRYYKDLCMSQQKAGIYPCVVTFAWVDGQWTVLE
jgi:hypothetical protein